MQSVDLQMVGVCVLPKESGGKSFHIIYVTEIGCAMLYIFNIKHSQRVRDVRAYCMCWTGHQQGGIISTPTVILSEKNRVHLYHDLLFGRGIPV